MPKQCREQGSAMKFRCLTRKLTFPPSQMGKSHRERGTEHNLSPCERWLCPQLEQPALPPSLHLWESSGGSRKVRGESATDCTLKRIIISLCVDFKPHHLYVFYSFVHYKLCTDFFFLSKSNLHAQRMGLE